MKPLDKKDMPKLFALIGLTVIAFGYGMYNLLAGPTPPPPPAVEETPKVNTNPTPAPVDVGRDQLILLSKLTEPSLPRDPFAPSGPASVAPTPVPFVPRPGASPIPWNPQPSKNVTIDFGPGAGTKVPDKPIVIPSPPPPTLSLQAVLVAEQPKESIAILRNGDDRAYVSPGDPVGNGFIVQAIHGNEIILVDSKNATRTHTIKLP